MKKIIFILWILTLLTSCSNNQEILEWKSNNIEPVWTVELFEANQTENKIADLEEKIEKLESKNRVLERYKNINFKEMKLIEKYMNPDDSNNNIYVYTNSFNKQNIDSVKNVENCARIRYKDNHSNDCFIFVWNEDYKKLLFISDYPISKAFEEKNIVSISHWFSDWGWSIITKYLIDIFSWDMTSQVDSFSTEDWEKKWTSTMKKWNIFDCKVIESEFIYLDLWLIEDNCLTEIKN